MGIKVECDGCGCSAQEYKEIGFIKKGFYCPDCQPSVNDYLAKRDDMHTYLAKLWDSGVSKLIEAWKSDHPGGRLPDE